MASGDTTAGWLLLDRYHSHALESAPSISPQKTRLTWYREFLSWPDSVLAQEPDLCLSAAFSSYYSKDLDHIERPLRLAEQAFLAAMTNRPLAEPMPYEAWSIAIADQPTWL